MPNLTNRATVARVLQIVPGSSRFHKSGRTRKSCRGRPGLTNRAGVTLVSQIASGSPWSHRSRRARPVRKEGEREEKGRAPPRKILRGEFLSLRFLRASPRGARSIDFDVGGLALEGLGFKTDPGGAEASILKSARLH